MNKISYKTAGVNIDFGNEVVRRIKGHVKSTSAPWVVSELGGFAALIDLSEITSKYRHPILVQSIDGVGTKTIIARMMGKYDTLGIDLLSASSNDILVVGARSLTLLDYIASDRLDPRIVEELVSGMAKACRDNGVSLVGGETAEMPSTYLPDEHDLVGIVTGIVDKNKIVSGKNIQVGDKVLGFLSSGLHTNGYSLARKLFFDVAKMSVDTYIEELSQTLGEALLAPHINYAAPVLDILENINIKGMAHITGGGLLENIPRVLPENCAIHLNQNSWEVPPIFRMMRQIGDLEAQEMYRVFNMGIGFILIVAEQNIIPIIEKMRNYPQVRLLAIGEVVTGEKEIFIK